MSTINMEFYDALLSINVPESKARKVAATVIGKDEMATRTDLLWLQGDFEKSLLQFQGDFEKSLLQLQNHLEKSISDNNKTLMFWVAAIVGTGVTLTLSVMGWLLHFYLS